VEHIRNFSIIAHIDHGKSTLADRMLEATKTIEKHRMKEQVLDSMELERERGITIKMQPVRMEYAIDGTSYVFNLIDTPGHIDFSYEVSRALKAVEGSLLLVDATQGVQAQTLTTLSMARELGIAIIPVVTKIDSPLARVKEVSEEVAKLLECSEEDIVPVSGKTGEGVHRLLREIVKRIPSPRPAETGRHGVQGLVFDFEYSNHRGIIVYLRMFSGNVKKGDNLLLASTKEKFSALEVGIFHPDQTEKNELLPGEIGYIVTGIKKPGVAFVGDTVTSLKNPEPALPGYEEPRPVVWASLYPESEDDFAALKQALLRLKLTDPAVSFEEETSGSLGRGFRCGFLGMLHLEIIMERLRREFDLELIMTTPSITYEVEYGNGKREKVYSPALFPDDGAVKTIYETWATGKIITPPRYVGAIMQLLFEHEAEVGESELFGDERTAIGFSIPMRELMRNFFDELKRVSSGFASLSYEIGEMRPADVVRLDILVADEIVPAFSRVVSRRRVQHEAELTVEKLHEVLPRQLFVVKIQGKALGRILSSRTLSALKKDVTGYLYGGDITRKMKLREKQKKGKKKMRERGKVNIPHDVFLKMMKGDRD
jgi:GTP-binding protein LepA